LNQSQYTYTPFRHSHPIFLFAPFQLRSQKKILGRKNVGGAFAPPPPAPMLRVCLLLRKDCRISVTHTGSFNNVGEGKERRNSHQAWDSHAVVCGLI